MLFFNVLPTPIPQEHPRTNFSNYHFVNSKKYKKIAPTHSNHGWPRSMLHLRPRHRIFEERLAEVHRGAAQIGRGSDFLLRHPAAVLIRAREERHETGHGRPLMGKISIYGCGTLRLGVGVDDFDVEKSWVVIMFDHSVQISSMANNIIYSMYLHIVTVYLKVS